MRVQSLANIYIVNSDLDREGLVAETELKNLFPKRISFGETFKAKKLEDVEGYYLLTCENGGIETVVTDQYFHTYFRKLREVAKV